jgi:hypothetical protein
MAAMMLAMAMPAFADKGGIPHAGSCGLGKDLVHDAQEDPTSPLARPKRPMNLPAIPGIRALVPLRHRAPQEGPGPLATSALLLALFTQVRGIGILGSSLAGFWIKPRNTPPRWP